MRLALLSFGSKAAMTIAQFGGAALVLIYFSPVQQGYYYTFIALIAIQSLFELGLSQVLVVFLAHERGSRIAPGADSSRAYTIARASFLDYCGLALAFMFVVGLLGLIFFSWPQQALTVPSSEWLTPWIALVFLSTVRLPLIWLEAVLEGLGWLSQVLVVRMMAHISWLLCLWFAAYSGFGLMSLALATTALLTVSYLGYSSRYGILRALLQRVEEYELPMDWRKETRLMRRRVSGTWIASYIISSTPIPLSLYILGPTQAGLVGIAFQFAAAIGVIAGALIGPRTSEASRLVSAKALIPYERLLHLTMQQTLWAGICVALIAAGILVCVPLYFPESTARLPSVWVVAPLLVAAVINSTLSCVAVFARAQKQEIFLRPLFAVAAVTALGTLIAQGIGGIGAISILHFSAALLITAPSVVIGFRSLVHKNGPRAT